MIIVSQDKDKIINFDNLTQVYITQDEEETAYFIRIETVNCLYDDLGKYETEERAKEVLNEIICIYRVSKGMDFTIGDEMRLSGFYDNEVYWMPIE